MSIEESEGIDKGYLFLESLLKIVFVDKTNNTLIQLFRYLFVGGVAFIADISTLALLTEKFAVHYLLSAGVAFLVGLTVNYLISIYWIFPKSSLSNRSAEFAVFAAVGVIGLGLNEAAMWIFTDTLSFHYMASKVISTAVVFFWNFIARKILLYR